MDKSLVVMLGLASSVIATIVVLHFWPGSRTGGGSGLVSNTVLDQGILPDDVDAHGYATDSPYLNRVATVVTALRPSGKIELDGQLLDVVAGGEFIAEGTPVKVIRVEGNRIVVQKHDATSDDASGEAFRV